MREFVLGVGGRTRPFLSGVSRLLIEMSYFSRTVKSLGLTH